MRSSTLRGEPRARYLIPISDTRRDDVWAAANPDLYAQFVAMGAANPYADEPGTPWARIASLKPGRT
jgi:hypothetical protein